MKLPLELLVAVGEMVLLAVGTSLLSAVGLYLELLAIDALTGGQLIFGLWLGLFGGVALYFGVYTLGLTELLPRMQRALTRQVQ